MRMGTYLCHVQFLNRVRQPVYGAGSGLYTISKVVNTATTKASCVSVAAYTRQLIIITFGYCLYRQKTRKSKGRDTHDVERHKEPQYVFIAIPQSIGAQHKYSCRTEIQEGEYTQLENE